MAITSGFFNSVDGDRKYNAEQLGNYFEGLISNGVFENVGDKMAVTAGEGMLITVGTGRAMINCHWIKNDAPESLVIDPSDVQLNRIDAIVLKLDLTQSGRKISIYVKKGTPASTATSPKLTRTPAVYELCLAHVSVKAKTTAIAQGNIIDCRGITDLCGYVTGLIKQVDTSDLFLQYQAAFEQYYTTMTAEFDAYIAAKQAAFDSWFSTLTESLHVDTSINKYQWSGNVTDASGYVASMPINIPEYEDGDVVFIHIGGVLLVEGTEFTIASNTITFTTPLKVSGDGVPVTIICIKSVIGGDVVGTKIDEINGEVI